MRANWFWLAVPFLMISLDARAADPSLARMEQVIGSYVTDKRFMGTVLVVKDGKTVLDKGYGSADLEWNIPNTPATKFRLGSITKQFTAASILLLEEKGKLKLTDPVRQILPDLPESWDKVTIFNLLTHTSGIFNYTARPDFKDFKSKHLTPAQIVDLVRDKPLDFQPGEKMSYSNTGYIVLGMVIEKLSGQSYAGFLKDNIFTPLQMNDTGYEDQAAILPLRARGYSRTRDGKLINADFIDMSVPFAAGALVSTTHDMLTWENALFAGKVVTPDSLAKMTTPFKNNYGFGLVIADTGGHHQVWHNGGIDGFNTIMANYPSDHLTIVVLDNIADGAPGDIAHKIADISFGKTVVLTSERKEVPVDGATLARYVGHYQLAPQFFLDITQDGNALYGQATKQPKFQLFAESQKDFFLKSVEAQVSFVTDGDGPALALVLHQSGQNITGTRVPN
jgi:CubicO group peptidase (beta-lactamase class C family)